VVSTCIPQLPSTSSLLQAAESRQDAATTGPDRGEKAADNIRYGQNISESGMGGMTTTSTGSANQEGGYGGTAKDKSVEEKDAGGERRAQKYGGMPNVGA
jgi:hypothetical protein